jgi:hypothetical protein
VIYLTFFQWQCEHFLFVSLYFRSLLGFFIVLMICGTAYDVISMQFTRLTSNEDSKYDVTRSSNGSMTNGHVKNGYLGNGHGEHGLLEEDNVEAALLDSYKKNKSYTSENVVEYRRQESKPREHGKLLYVHLFASLCHEQPSDI